MSREQVYFYYLYRRDLISDRDARAVFGDNYRVAKRMKSEIRYADI